MPFSRADGGSLIGAGALGAVNLGGALVLGAKLAALPPNVPASALGLGAVAGAYPLLLSFAVAFNAAPALRWALNRRTNAAIDKRNRARRLWRRALDAAADDPASAPSSYRRKRAAIAQLAASAARRVRGGKPQVAYSSAVSAAERSAADDAASMVSLRGLSLMRTPPTDARVLSINQPAGTLRRAARGDCRARTRTRAGSCAREGRGRRVGARGRAEP